VVFALVRPSAPADGSAAARAPQAAETASTSG